MVITFFSTRNGGKDISGVWVNSEISSDTHAFSHGDAFAQNMIKVGLYED